MSWSPGGEEEGAQGRTFRAWPWHLLCTDRYNVYISDRLYPVKHKLALPEHTRNIPY